MNLDTFQLTFLAILQGFTEFLPISSSGHLILPSQLLGWEDQGLSFDVAVHVGSLLAVVIYFWADVVRLLTAWLRSIVGRKIDADSRLAWLLIMATLPAGFAGLLLNDVVEDYGRSMLLVATTSIIFALLLFWSDRRGEKAADLPELSWQQALFIGFAQMLALIPGTSRSGVTMTAALFCNLTRVAAARFSFLLAIPIIVASGLLQGIELFSGGADAVKWLTLGYGAVISAVVAFACIHFFLKLIERIGFGPFVIYRLLLGIVLLGVYFG